MTLRILLSLVVLIARSGAQEIGSVRGESLGSYNVTNSWESGYRWASIGGDSGKYRSDVNYANGIRLLSSNLTVHSKDGKGKWFDGLVLATEGLGNDPYQTASLRVEKNRLYEYNFQWRQNAYVNEGLTVAAGEHREDLVSRWQDHDLTLFPQRWYRIHAGSSTVNESGPALTTVLPLDNAGFPPPVFTDVHRRFYDYRLGFDIDAGSWRFTMLRRWENYREGTYRGNTPGWLVNVNTTHKHYAVNGHFTYAGGARNFVFDQRLSTGHPQETFATGNAQRPVTTGDLSSSLMPNDRWTIVNNTAIQNTRIDGNSLLFQYDNSTQTGSLLYFQFLGIRTVSSSTDAQYRFTDRLTAYAGYRYATRRVRSIESLPDFHFSEIGSQSNHQHAGTAGVNWQMGKPLRLHVEMEVGRNDNPFFPISERNYHAIDSRLQFRAKTMRASAGYKQIYNNNSISITAYSSRSISWISDFSWQARRRVGFDLTYSNIHLDTIGGLAFFAGDPSSEVRGKQSTYVSNVHAAGASVRWNAFKRGDLLLGYSITRDTGDSRQAVATEDPVDALLNSVRAFPLSFQSPYARLSVRLAEKLRWNVSYRYYGYREDLHLFAFDQNYRAHTGTVSLLWAF